jgi:FdrA protein
VVVVEKKVIVQRGIYRDSIALMKVSSALSKVKGVTQAAVVMATELNKKLLGEIGFRDSEIERATPDDLIVALEASDSLSLSNAVEETNRLLSNAVTLPSSGSSPTSLIEALEIMPDANLALISVPGRYARREAMRALERGLNVFLFSSNVSRSDEVELKRVAKSKNLLVMGPDCGTAIINGTVLGFGNGIRRGPIGIVSASGTGLQEVSTLIHHAGLGVSNAIGTGTGDVSEEVGGMTMIQGIKLLEEDSETKVIVVISKPPARQAVEAVIDTLKSYRKPVVLNFIGTRAEFVGQEGIRSALTLEEASEVACELSGVKVQRDDSNLEGLISLAELERTKLKAEQRYVRGLFAGGTLCYESQVILRPILGAVFSNSPLSQEYKIEGDGESKMHTCIDMGAEEFVVGRAHPMIDYTLRKRRLLREALDPETAVILLDVELGYGSNLDPAGELLPVIGEAWKRAKEGDRHVSIVASVVGTELDPQGLDRQKKELSDAGVLVAKSNAEATRLSALIATRGATFEKLYGTVI